MLIYRLITEFVTQVSLLALTQETCQLDDEAL